jgi:hypothetical protein
MKRATQPYAAGAPCFTPDADAVDDIHYAAIGCLAYASSYAALAYFQLIDCFRRHSWPPPIFAEMMLVSYRRWLTPIAA